MSRSLRRWKNIAPLFWLFCFPGWKLHPFLWRRRSMPAQNSFDYAIVRVVPRVERGECINVGVILFSRVRRFLEARIKLDRERLLAFAPDLDLELVQSHLDMIPLICQGGPQAGPIG